MANEARLHDLLDLVEQARKEGNKAVEAQATAAYRRESMPEDVRAAHEQRQADAESALLAEQGKSAPTSVLHKALTGADLALGTVSGIATPALAGAAGMEATVLKNAGMNTDPARVRQAILDRGYKTHEGYGADVGQAVTEGIGKTVAPVVGPIAAGNKAVMDRLSPKWQDKLKDLEGLAGDTLTVAPAAAPAGKLLTRALADAVPSQVVAETAPQIARAAGLSVSPSATNNLAGAGERANVLRRGLEALGGEHAGHAENIVKNRPVVTDIVLQDVGLPAQTKIPASVSGLKDVLAKAAEPFEKTYAKMRARLGPATIPVDDLAEPISRIGRGTESLAKVPDAVEALKAHYSGLPPMSGGQMLDTMSDLRKVGYKALLSDNPETQAIGHAQIEIAKLLEGKLTAVADRAEPGLADEFKAARTGFAKLYTADAASVGNDIDPQAIRKIGERAGTNSGGMKLVEDMATHYEPDMQLKATAAPIGSQIARGSLITGGGALGGALGGPVGAVVGAAAPVVAQRAARVLVRATSGKAAVPQIRLGRALERYYKDRPAKPTQPFDLEPSPGRPVEPHQPPLPELGDMSSPMAESTQNPRTSLDLQPPPGRVGMNPAQRGLPFDNGDYIPTALPTVDEIIAKLRRDAGQR